MVDEKPDQLRRLSSISWYSSYQSQIVGHPRRSSTQEQEKSDDDESVGKTEDHRNITSANGTKGHADERSSLSEAKSEYLVTNGNDSDDEQDKNSKSNNVRNHQMFRPFSMVDLGQMKQNHDDNGTVEPKIRRSFSSLNWNDVYEEYKPPKRYEKPTNTKINTRLSRTFVIGAGTEKCKQCGGRLYEMEKIQTNHFSYHRSCFRCSKCQRLLNLGTFSSVDGQLFCKSHVLNSVTGLTGNQLSKDPKDDLTTNKPITYDHGEEVSMEVTLASISDIKSRFEIPSKFSEAATKNLKHQKSEEDRNIRPDISSHHGSGKDYPKVNEKDQVKAVKEMNQVNKEFEIRMAPDDSKRMTPTRESSLIMFDAERSNDDDETDFNFADAFAKFRSIEYQNESKTSSKHKKPIHRTTASKGEPNIHPMSQRAISPEKKNANLGYASAGYFKPSGSKIQPLIEIKDLPTKTVHERKELSKHAVKGSHPENGNIASERHEDEIEIRGIAKRLRNHWESKDVQDVRRHQTLTTKVHGHRNGGNTTAYKKDKVTPAIDITDGLKADGKSVNNKVQIVHKENIPQEKISVKEETDVNRIWIGSLDFTQNQLAKFKQLEAMAKKMTNPHTKKKFRWGVKEVSPLNHRRSSYVINQDRNAWTAEAHGRTPSQLSTGQEYGQKTFSGTSPTMSGGHEHRKITSSSHEESDDLSIPLNSVRETLAQFKLLEDFSRPPPNPVQAMTQQKNAMATTTKPYRDIIHTSYDTHVTAKD